MQNKKGIYNKTVVWVDWGILSRFLRIDSSNTEKYDIKQSRTGLSKLIGQIEKEVGHGNIQLIFGFQVLEAGNEARIDILEKLAKEFNILEYPTKMIGITLPYIAYSLIQISQAFLGYILFQRGRLDDQFLLEMRQSLLSQGVFDKRNFGDLEFINPISAKQLGQDFVDTFLKFRDRDKSLSKEDIYIAETDSILDYLRKISRENPRFLYNYVELSGIKADKNKVVNDFLDSNTFNTLLLPRVWGNLVTVWLYDKGRQLNSSDRGDLISLLEIATFADIGYVDKRTYACWNLRPNKSVILDIRKSSNLEFRS